MALKRKYTEVNKYYLDDNFLDSLDSLERHIAVQIVDFIDDNIWNAKVDDHIDTFLGGLADNNVDPPVTFQVELHKNKKNEIILYDIQLISMDDYLDMYNMKLII